MRRSFSGAGPAFQVMIRRDANVPQSGRGTDHGDRRRVCRYPTVVERAYLGWWQESTFVTEPACLVDLSLNGCMLALDRLPAIAAGGSVYVHLNMGAQHDWVEGRMIAARKRILRKCEVRVSFSTPLGYEHFKELVYGPEYLGEHAHRSVPNHEWDQFWK